MAAKKEVKVEGYIQKGRDKTRVKEHERSGRKAHIKVKDHSRARRRTKEEIDKWGTRKDPKIKN